MAADPVAIENVKRNPMGQLVVRVKGRDEPVTEAQVARCFPWSFSDSYISIRDKQGKEIVLLHDLSELDAGSRSVVEKELRDKVLNPKILRVLDHKRDFGVTSLTALTDRGQVTFQIRSRDDIRAFSPTRALFRDADGNVYEVADLRELDHRSRKFIQDYF